MSSISVIAGNDANSGASSEATVKTWEQAYSLLSDGGTIVVVGMSTAPSAKIVPPPLWRASVQPSQEAMEVCPVERWSLLQMG